MRKTLLLLSFFGLSSVIQGKFNFFNDYNQPIEWNEEIPGESYKRIEELANYLRKRAQEADVVKIVDDGNESENGGYQERDDPSFEFRFPNDKPEYVKEREFAIGPSDPRYYQEFVNFEKPHYDKGNTEEPKKKESIGFSKTTPVRDPGDYSGDEKKNLNSGPYRSSVYQTSVSEVIEAEERSDIYFIAIVAGCSAAAVFAMIAIGISCYRLQKNAKAAAEVDYPAYGITGPHKDASPTSGDRRLAQSAQMYHYQHQKQQIIAMESRASNERHGSISDAESDEENEEGDYTVYECPGLASTGEMEVKNPMFQDDHTPATPHKAATTSKPSQEPPK